MKKRILIDVDGVLLDFEHGFQDFMKTKGHLAINYNLKKDCLTWYNLNMSDVIKYVEEYQTDYYHFSRLKPCSDSQESINKLSKDGYRFIAITATYTYAETKKARIKNLIDCFGDIFDDIFCVGFNSSKTEHLSKFSSTWWIEDSPENATIGGLLGHKSILFNHPRNENSDNSPYYTRVKNWNEIEEMILTKNILR